jgi:hypothetical protein
MATANSIIVLDDDDEDEVPAQPGPSHSPPSPALRRAEAPGSSEPHGPGGSSSSGGKKCYKLENEKLFEEVSFRGEDTCTPGRGILTGSPVLSSPLTPLHLFLSTPSFVLSPSLPLNPPVS